MAIRFPGQPSLAGCQFYVVVWQQGQKSQVTSGAPVGVGGGVATRGREARSASCIADCSPWENVRNGAVFHVSAIFQMQQEIYP
jgi:hypothetical protein